MEVKRKIKGRGVSMEERRIIMDYKVLCEEKIKTSLLHFWDRNHQWMVSLFAVPSCPSGLLCY